MNAAVGIFVICALLLYVAVCLSAIAVGLVRFVAAIFAGMQEQEAHYRRIENRCLQCGYRLRGNTSGVCSECGAAVIPGST